MMKSYPIEPVNDNNIDTIPWEEEWTLEELQESLNYYNDEELPDRTC